MQEQLESQRAMLKDCLLKTLRCAQVKMRRAMETAERRDCFDLMGGPHSMMDELLNAQSLSDQINFIDNLTLDT